MNRAASEGSTDADGQFEAGPFTMLPRGLLSGEVSAEIVSSTHLTFRKDGYAIHRLDPGAVPVAERDRVVVTLTRGTTLAGIVVDERGSPLTGVPVVVQYGHVYDLRKGTRTDAEGRWRFEHLASGAATLHARAFAHDARAKREIVVGPDDLDMRIVAMPIRLSRPPTTVSVLGLTLCDVDDEIRAAYEVSESVHVLILDPGSPPDRLGIGRLEKGYGLWMVGDDAVTSVRETLEGLLAANAVPWMPGAAQSSTPGEQLTEQRVVYTFLGERMEGTNTQRLLLSPEARAEIRAALDRLPK